ncbi:MAG: HAD-IA family hydrolase, partial [Clostridiales bacterium]|nr:HAD-IA family hydrolase [Clostridiales bacterium]
GPPPLHPDRTPPDSNKASQAGAGRFPAKRGLPWAQAYHEGVVHASLPAGARFTKKFCHLEDSEEDIVAEWLAMVRQSYGEEIPLKPGVRAFLSRCADRGERMAVYTSCARPLCEAALRHHGIDRCFEAVLYASELGVEKRAPEGFCMVAAQLGVAPEDCVFFDDSPLSCAGAREAGMVTVGVYDPMFAASEEEMRRSCHSYLRSFEEATLTPEGTFAFLSRD